MNIIARINFNCCNMSKCYLTIILYTFALFSVKCYCSYDLNSILTNARFLLNMTKEKKKKKKNTISQINDIRLVGSDSSSRLILCRVSWSMAEAGPLIPLMKHVVHQGRSAISRR